MRLRAFPASGRLVGQPSVVLEGFQPAAYYVLVHYEEFRAFVVWQNEAVAQICAAPLNSSLSNVSEPTLLFVGGFQQTAAPVTFGGASSTVTHLWLYRENLGSWLRSRRRGAAKWRQGR